MLLLMFFVSPCKIWWQVKLEEHMLRVSHGLSPEHDRYILSHRKISIFQHEET